jgi:hypothetical protein
MPTTYFDSTTTNTKINVIKNENAFFKECFPTRKNTEKSIGVIGNPEGLTRHVKQHLDLGYSLNNINFVEISPVMHKLLKKEIDKNQSLHSIKESLEIGNIFQPRIIDKNVTYVDADITTALNIQEFTSQVKELESVYPNMNSVVIVHSSRRAKIISDAALKDFEEFEDLFDTIKKCHHSKKDAIIFISCFKNVYDKYTYGKDSGKAAFIKKLTTELKEYSKFVQSYPGVGNKTMTSFSLRKDYKNTIEVKGSYFEENVIPKTVNNYIKTLHNHFEKWKKNKTLSPKVWKKYNSLLTGMGEWVDKA